MQRIVLIAMGLLVATWASPVVAQEEATDIAKLEAKVKDLEAQITERSRLFEEDQQMLMEFGGVDAVRDEASELRQRQNELDFERIVMEARREAMQKQIERLARKVHQALAEDKLLAIMREALVEQARRHEELVKRGYVKSGYDQAAEARAASLSEQLQVTERENEVAKQAGQEIINRLNGELVDMEIREAELVARARHVQNLREQSRRNLEIVQKVLHGDAELDRARRQLAAAEMQLRFAKEEAQRRERKTRQQDQKVDVTPMPKD